MLNSKTFNKRGSRKSAFTLIELSIVLIIIGLLVAGVTGGASLIRSAQLRSVMSEARGYSVAVNAFRVQYDRLPGDYGTAIGDSSFGNQNDRINFVDAQTTAVSSLEGVIAWYHLINSGNVDTTSLTVVATGPGSGNKTFNAANQTTPALTPRTHIPGSKLDGMGWVFDNNAGRNVLIATGAVGPVTVAALGTAYNVVPTGGLTPTDALSIDVKLDDGTANTGRVRGSSLLPAANSVQANCFSSGIYTTAITTRACAVEFTVDIS